MFESLVWIVPALVAAAGCWRPRGGLLVLAASLPLFGTSPGGPYLAALDVAGLAAIATAWRPGRAERSGFEWPVVAWVGVSTLSLFPLAYHPPSWTPSLLFGLLKAIPDVPSATLLYTWRALLNLLLGFGLYHALRSRFRGASLRPLSRALGLGLGAALAFGLAEHAGLVDLSSYRAIGGPLYETRLHSFFFHSGWLAEYLVVATPFAVAGMMTGNGRERGLAIALLVLALAALLFTEQRGGWFAALAQLGAFLVVAGRRVRAVRDVRWVAAVSLGIVGVAALLTISRPEVLSPVLQRLAQGTSDLSGRTHLWRVSARLASERPLLGWGLGAFAPAYDRVHPRGSSDAWPYRDTAHSLYFQIAAERGLLGLMALSALALYVLLGLAPRWQSNEQPASALALGLWISAIGFIVNGAVQHLFYLKNVEWLFWMLLGAASLLTVNRRLRFLDRYAQAILVLAALALPWRLFGLEPLRGPGDRSFGFHEIELNEGGSWQWTSELAAKWIPRQGDVLVIPVANGHPRASEHPVELVVRIDGREKLRKTLRGGWDEHRIELEPPRREGVVLELQSSPSFRPFMDFRAHPGLDPSTDSRCLGVALGTLRWERAEGDGLSRPSSGRARAGGELPRRW